jgi:hypothetical protein
MKFYIFILIVAIGVGYLCSQTSNVVNTISSSYQKEESKVDKLISIFEDWKNKPNENILKKWNKFLSYKKQPLINYVLVCEVDNFIIAKQGYSEEKIISNSFKVLSGYSLNNNQPQENELCYQ